MDKLKLQKTLSPSEYSELISKYPGAIITKVEKEETPLITKIQYKEGDTSYHILLNDLYEFLVSGFDIPEYEDGKTKELKEEIVEDTTEEVKVEETPTPTLLTVIESIDATNIENSILVTSNVILGTDEISEYGIGYKAPESDWKYDKVELVDSKIEGDIVADVAGTYEVCTYMIKDGNTTYSETKSITIE